MERGCDIEGCDRKHNAQGLCLRHYMAALRAGNLQPLPKRGYVERFWDKVAKAGPDECWLWQASCAPNGYGTARDGDKRHIPAHRLSWILANGTPIPDGLIICHRCDVPRCVNPAHLFLGTYKDNVDDMVAKGRDAYDHYKELTHCSHGHELTDANTYHFERNGYACRSCRECRRLQAAKSRARRHTRTTGHGTGTTSADREAS